MSTEEPQVTSAPAAADGSPPVETKPVNTPKAPGTPEKTPSGHSRLRVVGIVVALILIVIALPHVIHALHTVSTDDAYVNSYVTFVAPRVGGQVARVLVDDNYRVKKGDVLVELDPEPFQVQVAIKEAAVNAAQADLNTAQATVRSEVGGLRSLRFQLEHAIEEADNQVALLSARSATLDQAKAALVLAQQEYARAKRLARYLMAAGLFTLGVGNYWMSLLNLDVSPWHVVWPRVVVIAGLSMLFAPLNVAAFLYIPKELRGAAVGLLALLRNEGGSVGTSVAQTIQERREQFHVLRLGEQLDRLNPAVNGFLADAGPAYGQQTADPVGAKQMTLQALDNLRQQQASALAYFDTFVFFAWVSFALILLVFMMKRSVAEKGAHIAAE